MASSYGYQRMRAGKACISCRRRKVKCEMSSKAPKCRACERRRSECVLANAGAQLSSKHGVFDYSAALEQSIGSFIRPLDSNPFQSASIYPDIYDSLFLNGAGYGPISYDPLSALLNATSLVSNEDHPYSPCFMLPRPLVDQPGNHRIFSSGEIESVELGSPYLSIISPEGLQWLYEKAGDGAVDLEDFDSPLHPQNKFIDDDPLADGCLTEPFIELPSKCHAVQLFDTFFREINPFCPLFDENEFVSRVEQEYPPCPQSSPSWWACVNATIALSCAFLPGLHSKAWFYWKNSTLSLNSFFLERPQLSSAQALLAMTAFLIGSFSAAPSQTFVSLALRILHGLNPAESERSPVYRRILGITHGLDIDISLRSAKPPTQPIPAAYLSTLYDDSADSADSLDPHSSDYAFASYNFDMFGSYCKLVTLKNHVYRELYSTRAEDKSDAEIIESVGQLDTLLQDWKNGIPQDYRPEVAQADDIIRRDPHLSVLYMHFNYYSCILAIHRRAISRATWSMDLDPRSGRLPFLRSPNSRTLISTQLCMRAARKSLKLVQHIPQDHTLFAGSISYCTMFALMILSMIIVQDPQVTGNADLKLMLAVEDFFSEISMVRPDENINDFVQCCARYRSITEAAIKQRRDRVVRKQA